MTAPVNRYTEALKGDPIVPIGQGIYEESETAKGTLGTRVAFADGRVFRYCKNGATALSAGKYVKAGAFAAQINKAVAAAVGVGSNSITLVTSSAITTAAEGLLQINAGPGQGIQYKIKKTAANDVTATSTDVIIYDHVATALTEASKATVLYNDYEQATLVASITDIIIGVPPIEVTPEYYFWVQTWGWACVLSEGTPAAGNVVEIGVNSGGTTTCNADTAMAVGIQGLVGVDTEYKPVFLTIKP